MENRKAYQSAFHGPRMVIRDWFGQRACQFPLAHIVLSLCLCLTVLSRIIALTNLFQAAY